MQKRTKFRKWIRMNRKKYKETQNEAVGCGRVERNLKGSKVELVERDDQNFRRECRGERNLASGCNRVKRSVKKNKAEQVDEAEQKVVHRRRT